MQNWPFVLLLGLFAASCGHLEVREDDDVVLTTNYSAQIISPAQNSNKNAEGLDIHVNFAERSGLTIQHINVRIFEKGNVNDEIYNGPIDSYVNEDSGNLEYKAHLNLAHLIATAAQTDWIVEAKVWEEGQEAQLVATKEFRLDL